MWASIWSAKNLYMLKENIHIIVWIAIKVHRQSGWFHFSNAHAAFAVYITLATFCRFRFIMLALMCLSFGTCIVLSVFTVICILRNCIIISSFKIVIISLNCINFCVSFIKKIDPKEHFESEKLFYKIGH